MKTYRNRLKKWFPLSLRDALVTLAIIAVASALSTALHLFSDSDSYAPLVFVPATLLVSLLTNGYFFGMLMSVVSVIGVNIVFTYPYYRLNFSIREIVKISKNPAQRHISTGKHKCTLKITMQS